MGRRPVMRVRVVQTGGYAGLTRIVDVDLSELPPEDARAASSALATLSATASESIPAASQQPRYEVTISEGGETRTVILYETQMPAELRALLHDLLKKGHYR
jgi:hypothetical protein